MSDTSLSAPASSNNGLNMPTLTINCANSIVLFPQTSNALPSSSLPNPVPNQNYSVYSSAPYFVGNPPVLVGDSTSSSIFGSLCMPTNSIPTSTRPYQQYINFAHNSTGVGPQVQPQTYLNINSVRQPVRILPNVSSSGNSVNNVNIASKAQQSVTPAMSTILQQCYPNASLNNCAFNINMANGTPSSTAPVMAMPEVLPPPPYPSAESSNCGVTFNVSHGTLSTTVPVIVMSMVPPPPPYPKDPVNKCGVESNVACEKPCSTSPVLVGSTPSTNCNIKIEPTIESTILNSKQGEAQTPIDGSCNALTMSAKSPPPYSAAVSNNCSIKVEPGLESTVINNAQDPLQTTITENTDFLESTSPYFTALPGNCNIKTEPTYESANLDSAPDETQTPVAESADAFDMPELMFPIKEEIDDSQAEELTIEVDPSIYLDCSDTDSPEKYFPVCEAEETDCDANEQALSPDQLIPQECDIDPKYMPQSSSTTLPFYPYRSEVKISTPFRNYSKQRSKEENVQLQHDNKNPQSDHNVSNLFFNTNDFNSSRTADGYQNVPQSNQVSESCYSKSPSVLRKLVSLNGKSTVQDVYPKSKPQPVASISPLFSDSNLRYTHQYGPQQKVTLTPYFNATRRIPNILQQQCIMPQSVANIVNRNPQLARNVSNTDDFNSNRTAQSSNQNAPQSNPVSKPYFSPIAPKNPSVVWKLMNSNGKSTVQDIVPNSKPQPVASTSQPFSDSSLQSVHQNDPQKNVTLTPPVSSTQRVPIILPKQFIVPQSVTNNIDRNPQAAHNVSNLSPNTDDSSLSTPAQYSYRNMPQSNPASILRKLVSLNGKTTVQNVLPNSKAPYFQSTSSPSRLCTTNILRKQHNVPQSVTNFLESFKSMRLPHARFRPISSTPQPETSTPVTISSLDSTPKLNHLQKLLGNEFFMQTCNSDVGSPSKYFFVEQSSDCLTMKQKVPSVSRIQIPTQNHQYTAEMPRLVSSLTDDNSPDYSERLFRSIVERQIEMASWPESRPKEVPILPWPESRPKEVAILPWPESSPLDFTHSIYAEHSYFSRPKKCPVYKAPKHHVVSAKRLLIRRCRVMLNRLHPSHFKRMSVNLRNVAEEDLCKPKWLTETLKPPLDLFKIKCLKHKDRKFYARSPKILETSKSPLGEMQRKPLLEVEVLDIVKIETPSVKLQVAEPPLAHSLPEQPKSPQGKVKGEPLFEAMVLDTVNVEPPLEAMVMDTANVEPLLEAVGIDTVNVEPTIKSVVMDTVNVEPPLEAGVMDTVNVEPLLEAGVIDTVNVEKPIKSVVIDTVNVEPPIKAAVIDKVNVEPPSAKVQVVEQPRVHSKLSVYKSINIKDRNAMKQLLKRQLVVRLKRLENVQRLSPRQVLLS